MIIKNSKDIRKIYFGSTPAPSLNYNGSKAWQHIVDEYVPPVFTCPDVVQTIDGYDGDAKEVYAKDTKKWYMRNNLGNYEEYGILEEVQSLASATFYEGKLVIFDNHEYESIGGNWVDIGAAQGTTKKIKSPSYIYNDSIHLFSIPVAYTGSTDTTFNMRVKPMTNGGGSILGDGVSDDSNDYRVFMYSGQWYFDIVSSRINGGSSYLNKDANIQLGNYYIKDLATGSNVVTGATQTYQRTNTMRLGLSSVTSSSDNDMFQLSALTMYHGETLERDFLPAIDGNDICLYDKVSDAYFKSDNGKMPLSGGTITEVEVWTIKYPKDYDQKDAPEDNVTVESLDQIECPYEGMTAYVDGVRYTYENGEWIEHTETDWSKEYLTFEAIEDGQFKLARLNNPVTCQYSLDNGATWTTLSNDTWTPTVQAGHTIKWKADISPIASETNRAGGVGVFTATGRFNAMGNAYSLLWSSGFGTVTSLAGKSYALNQLFYQNNKVVSCENLALPALTIAEKCYRNMFRECTSLTTPPSVLPSMSLTTYCYVGMFNGCTALTKSPYLPALSLALYCYRSMFINCQSLIEIRAMFTTTPSSSYMYNWVQGVQSGGTFYKNANATWSNTFGVSQIPSGWTVVTEQPQA